MELITLQRQRSHIARFPVLSSAEILNNNPHKSLAVSVNVPHLLRDGIEPTHQKILNNIKGHSTIESSREDLLLLKIFSNLIHYYLYYHMGSGSQVGSEAPRFQISDFCGNLSKWDGHVVTEQGTCALQNCSF